MRMHCLKLHACSWHLPLNVEAPYGTHNTRVVVYLISRHEDSLLESAQSDHQRTRMLSSVLPFQKGMQHSTSCTAQSSTSLSLSRAVACLVLAPSVACALVLFSVSCSSPRTLSQDPNQESPPPMTLFGSVRPVLLSSLLSSLVLHGDSEQDILQVLATMPAHNPENCGLTYDAQGHQSLRGSKRHCRDPIV